MESMKRFLVINTSFFGDILLTEPLCRNIKRSFPGCSITFIANKPFADAARYGKGVDEVVSYDKKGEHRGIFGALKFYRRYRRRFAGGFDAAFVIYGNERGIVLAKLFGAKKVYADNKGLISCLLDNPRHIDYKGRQKVQMKNSALLEFYTHNPAMDLPMRYVPPQEAYDSLEVKLQHMGLSLADNAVGLCTTSKKIEKDMPPSDCIELIGRLKKAGYMPLLLGAGERARQYAASLKQSGCTGFADMTDMTTIPELGALLAQCRALISVDTGTMHLGLSTGTPAVCLFYISTPQHLAAWAPEPELYRAKVLTGHITADEMMRSLEAVSSADFDRKA